MPDRAQSLTRREQLRRLAYSGVACPPQRYTLMVGSAPMPDEVFGVEEELAQAARPAFEPPPKPRTWLEFIEQHQVLVTVIGTVAATALTGLGAYAVSSWRRRVREQRIRELHDEQARAISEARLIGESEVERVQSLYQRLIESELNT